MRSAGALQEFFFEIRNLKCLEPYSTKGPCK